MNILAERRAELGLTQPEVSTALRRADKRMDVGMVSRFERGACLPTPPVMNVIETVLQASRFELYDFKDIDLVDLSEIEPETADAPQDKPQAIPKRKETRFRKCFRMRREFVATMPEDLLAVCGFNSWQSWFDSAIRSLLHEYTERSGKQHGGAT